jgi:hypothetical protein
VRSPAGSETVPISTTTSPTPRVTEPREAFDWPGWIIDGCRRLLQDGRVALAVIAALIVGTAIVELRSLINHDTAWYLYAGSQYLAGGQLYRDVFVDVNPPLGFFLTLPPVILARLTGLFAVDLFIVYVYLLIVLSLAATWWLLRADSGLSRIAQRGLMILAAVVLTVTPADQFGQREHLMMVLALPYLALAVLSARGHGIPWPAATAIGLAAGLGFAIKPYYLLVPLALEVYRLAAGRGRRTLLRPETLGLAATLVAYALVVVLVTPEYLTRIVPYALEVYNQAYQNPLLVVLWRIETVMLPVGCLVHVATRRNQLAPQLGDVFMIASAVFFITYLAQMKGWDYQLYPASSCLILGYGALLLNHLAASRSEPAAPGATSLTRGIAVASLLLIAILTGNDAVHLGYKLRFTEIMTPYVERYARNHAIVVLGSNVSAGFPLVNFSRVDWSSRFPTLWLLPGVIRKRASGEASDPALLDEMESFTRDAVIADLTARPPDLIMVDDRDRKTYFGDLAFDYLDYFKQDPRFARIWSDYVWVAEEVDFDIYRRRCAPDCQSSALPTQSH